ncbi:MAG: hypothetical protein ACFB9M_11405 [Myxococcota bacterium]
MVWVAVLCALTAAGIGSSREAVDAIASGSARADEATAYLRAQGRAGLWALNSAAKKAKGTQRIRLLSALGDLPFEGAEWALKIAYDAKDPASQEGAVRGLSKLDGHLARRILVDGLSAEAPSVRAAAVDGLVDRVDEVRSSVEALLEQDSPDTRIGILALARRSKDPELMRASLAVGLVDSRPEVQAAALETLEVARYGEYSDETVALIRSPDPQVAMNAVKALANLPVRGREARLGEVLADASVPPEIRREVLVVLRNRSEFDALWGALAATPDGAELVRAHLRTHEVAPEEPSQWVAGLARPASDERRVARAAVAGLGTRAVPALVAGAGSSDPFLRDRSLSVLSEAGPEALQELLEKGSRSEVPEQRAGAISALILMSRPSEARRYLRALDDDSPVVRAAAARALASLGSELVDEVLLERVPDLDLESQEAMMLGASTRADPQFRTELAIRLLASESGPVRRRAIEALSPAETERALQALQAHLRTAPLEEKTLAIKAIGESRLPEAGSLLVGLVTDVDPDVRKAALAYVDQL